MEVLKINLKGYYNYDPIVRFKQLYDMDCTDEDNIKECSVCKNIFCEICKENILEFSSNISSNINKLFYLYKERI